MSATNAIAAIALANDILSLVVNAQGALQAVSASIRQAQTEGRDLTDDELDALRNRRVAVVAELQAEISRRQQAARVG